MRDTTKNTLIELGLTAIATVGILAVLGVTLFVAFNYFDGWNILIAIAVELALLVVIFHVYRWSRYPGLFESKSSNRLLFEVLGSILLVCGLPLIAVLAKLHIARLLPLDQIAISLGLDFRFKNRQMVQISAVAPSLYHPGKTGRISRIRVATENDSSHAQHRSGEVIYTVRFAEGVADVPEEHVLTVSSVSPVLTLR